MRITLNVTRKKDSQDMISRLSRELNLSPEEAIKESVNESLCNKIIEAKWASIALDCWGHASFEKKEKLANPIIDVEFTDEQYALIEKVKRAESKDGKLPEQQVIMYFILFKLESLGYHI